MVKKGPAKSIAILENARRGSFTLIRGKGAITWLAGFALRLLHSMQFFSQARISSLAAMIQKREDKSAKVWLVPLA